MSDFTTFVNSYLKTGKSFEGATLVIGSPNSIDHWAKFSASNLFAILTYGRLKFTLRLTGKKAMIGFLKNLELYGTQGSWEKLETHARQLSGPSDQWLWIYSTRKPIPINAPRLDLE